jgi:hypothetical protein
VVQELRKRLQTVEKIMGKPIITALAIASVFLSASPASATYYEAVYVTSLYRDSSHTEWVGTIYPECGPNYAIYKLYGTDSQYSGAPEFVGYCTEHGLEYV